jgi:hypothetical protein
MSDPLEIDEQPRSLRYSQKAAGPVDLLRRQVQKSAQAESELLADVACEQFELAQVLQQVAGPSGGEPQGHWQAVGIINHRLLAVLAGYQVTTEDAQGKPWTSQMLSDYELISSVENPQVTESRVSHVRRPAVRRFGKIVRKGQVLVDKPPAPAGGQATQQGEANHG